MTKVTIAPGDYAGLHQEVVSIVESARRTEARNVNAVMTAAYWEIGRRNRRQRAGRAGARRLRTGIDRPARGRPDAPLRTRLRPGESGQHARVLFRVAGGGDFPDSVWKIGSPRKCPDAVWKITAAKDVVDAAATAPDYMALATRFTLPWSAYVRLLSVKTAAARAFYETEALREGWSVRQLDRQIGSQLYERLALSRNKAALLRKAADVQPRDLLTPE